MYVCMYVCMFVCLYVCMFVCLYVCMSVCTHTHARTHARTRARAHTRARTYTHTHTQPRCMGRAHRPSQYLPSAPMTYLYTLVRLCSGTGHRRHSLTRVGTQVPASAHAPRAPGVPCPTATATAPPAAGPPAPHLAPHLPQKDAPGESPSERPQDPQTRGKRAPQCRQKLVPARQWCLHDPHVTAGPCSCRSR
jgi:hypothetical protein